MKIGYTTCVARRLLSVRMDARRMYRTGARLVASVAGTRELESQFHAQFAASRDVYEWFRNTPEIQKCVGDIVAAVVRVKRHAREKESWDLAADDFCRDSTEPVKLPAPDAEVREWAAAMGRKGGAARAKALESVAQAIRERA